MFPPYAPYLLMKMKETPNEERSIVRCHLSLHADLSSTSDDDDDDEPIAEVRFLLYDRTILTLPTPNQQRLYAFPCPLTPPFLGHFRTKASHYFSYNTTSRAVASMIPPDFPIEPEPREFFESEISEFLHDVTKMVKEEGFDAVRVVVLASVERVTKHYEMDGLVEELKESVDMEELWRSSSKVEKTELEVMIEKACQGWKEKEEEEEEEENKGCAVCFEEVEMSWFKGVELCCSHVFHLKCIVPWLMKKNSCPMCRCKQTMPLPNLS